MPVLVFDEGLSGNYEAGQVIEGERAERLLENHGDYFVSVTEEEEEEVNQDAV